MKIVSLVPSQSELLWYLGLREELVGITKFCIYPEAMFRSVERVGGTKTVNMDVIEELKPDLIIANKEENEKVQVESMQDEYKVHVTDIYTLDDAIHMIGEVGALVKRSAKAHELVQAIKAAFENLPPVQNPPRVLYLIWKNPFMAAGKNTFIDDMLSRAGYANALERERYPNLTLQDIHDINPDYIFLSSEPYPFAEKHKPEFAPFAGDKIHIVNGEYFSWYGSRLKDAPLYFTKLRTTAPPYPAP